MKEAPDGPGMQFIVGGYDPGEAYGSVYAFDLPDHHVPQQRNPGDEFGMTWGGQLNLISRIIHGYDPALLMALQQRLNMELRDLEELAESLKPRLDFRIPYQVLPLQDCIDLATFLIRATITAQNLGIGVRGMGGQVAYLTRTKPLAYPP